MGRILLSFMALVAIISSTSNLKADDHLDGPINLQVNVCKLNEGRSIAQYNKAQNAYIKWSKKNDVEVYVARHTPVFSHDDFMNDRGFDFIEILGGSHKVSGKAWDKWLGTKEGQKLAADWQKNATCYVKWGHSYPVYLNEEEIESSSDRYVSWNWCSINDGISYDDLQGQHDLMVDELKKDSNGIMGWFVMAPQTGAAHAPGDFVHLAVFKNIENFMEYKESFANGGWRGYREYNETYASCIGEELYSEKILNNPNN